VDAGEDIIGVSWTHLHANFHPANEHFDRGSEGAEAARRPGCLGPSCRPPGYRLPASAGTAAGTHS
jgi:hypothetical protein